MRKRILTFVTILIVFALLVYPFFVTHTSIDSYYNNYHTEKSPEIDKKPWEYVVNLTDILASKALRLWNEYGNRSVFLIPRFNQLFNVSGGYDVTTLPFFIYAFAITGNKTYLKYAFRAADEIIKLDLEIDPAYFLWLSFFNKKYEIYAKGLLNKQLQKITFMGLPSGNKTYRVPWDVMHVLSSLLKSYIFDSNKEYLYAARKIIFAIFQYLADQNTMVINDGYKLDRDRVLIVDNFQRVYSAGLLISNMLFLYLLTNDSQVLELLQKYVYAVNKYFWVGDHWAYRVYSNGTHQSVVAETNFYKLDYALLLYHLYIEQNETILTRIINDIKYNILHNSKNYIFTHHSGVSQALVYAQLGSFIYLMKVLNSTTKLDEEVLEWMSNHINMTFKAFMKEYGLVRTILDVQNFPIDSYGPYITLYSTAYLYSLLYYFYPATFWGPAEYPFPLKYDPNSDLPFFLYFTLFR